MDENEEIAQEESGFGKRKEPNSKSGGTCGCNGKTKEKSILMAISGIVIATVSFLLGRISGEYNP
ncbi:hypothetical protein FACS1894130_05090 [Spirochaetia bacterium]|nr:hypothetical protein FACS1894130_05090 [Spirochaetia bacterium]